MTASAHPRTRPREQRLGTAIAVAAAGSVAANAVIAAVARALGAPGTFQPLTPAVFVLWTVVGTVVGALGWRLVARRAARPARTLARLVVVVVALSLVPDVAVYVTRSLPGTTGTGVLALVAMHLATAAVAVTAYRRFLPVTR